MPSVELLKIISLTGMSRPAAVSSSPISIEKPPSPHIATTWRSGEPTLAPIACGIALAIEPWLNDARIRRPGFISR